MATDYFVSTTGNNANTGVSMDQPWKQINHAVDNINPGDTIFVDSGTYNEYVSISKSGEESKYKTLKTYQNNKVIIKRDSYGQVGIGIDADFWNIDGFDITETGHPVTIGKNKHHINVYNLECYDIDGALLVDDGANNILINGCNFYRPHDSGVNFIGLRGENDQICHHITITDCTFDDCGHNSINLWDSGKDPDYYGLYDVTIERCVFTDGTQIAIGTNFFAVERMIVRDCVFDNYQRGIQCVMRNCLIENCVITNHKAHFVYCAADSKNIDVTVRGLKAHAQKSKTNDRCICFQSCTGTEAYNNEISGYFKDANSDVIPPPPNPKPDPTQDEYPDHPDDDLEEPDNIYPNYTPYPFQSQTPILEHTNEFGYQNYSANPEWEYLGNIKSNVVRHFYNWDDYLTSKENARQIYNPLHFGLPNETNLCMGGGPIQWTYLRIIGPEYAVRYNNSIYSNSTEMIYEVGYLPMPKRSLNGVTIDSVTASKLYHKTNAVGDDMLTVNITCEWHKTKRTATGTRKKFYTTILYQKTRNTITKWETVDEYNKTVECVIINHSGFYNTINMTGLPTDASHYNISVKMGNVSKYILKSSYVYFKNETVNYQLYDMYDYDFYDLYGVSPYGKDQFVVPKGYVDNITIVVSSPFESYELKTNITRIDKKNDAFDGDIYAAIMCFLCMYVLYRMFFKW